MKKVHLQEATAYISYDKIQRDEALAETLGAVSTSSTNDDDISLHTARENDGNQPGTWNTLRNEISEFERHIVLPNGLPDTSPPMTPQPGGTTNDSRAHFTSKLKPYNGLVIATGKCQVYSKGKKAGVAVGPEAGPGSPYQAKLVTCIKIIAGEPPCGYSNNFGAAKDQELQDCYELVDRTVAQLNTKQTTHAEHMLKLI